VVSRASANTDHDTNAGSNVQATGIQVVNQHARQLGGGGGDAAFSVGSDLSSAQDRMESGKR
jgi:hypothetical protein